MARVLLPTSQPFYDAAKSFVERCLRQDRSLFTPGVAIWTKDNLDELHRRFNSSPDESGDSFEHKFQRQLAGATPEIYQLAGELIYVHLLIATGNIGGGAKRTLIHRVLGWSPRGVAIPKELDAALDTGLARVGTAFLTYRPFQLWFLIDFARAWKGLPTAEQERLLADPWAFKAMVFALPISRAYAQREALLHIVYPDTFEAIVSREHKREYANLFRDLIATPSGDVDRDLKQIRTVLDARYGPGHGLYAIRDGNVNPLPPAGPLPRSLGTALKPYVRLIALLDEPSYTPTQIVERFGRVSPPIANLAAPPDPDALVGDLLRLRLLESLAPDGTYRRWAHLNSAIESQVLRYAALTLLVPLGDGSHELPALRAPLDGDPHPAAACPYPDVLLPWYAEAGLARQIEDGRWQASPDALSPMTATNDCARALNTFLGYLTHARAGQAELPPITDDALPPLDPTVLDERIAEIQRELLIDRSTILRIYRALVSGNHVILSGPPGTGKTHLAKLLPRVLWRDAEPVLQLTLTTDPRRSPTDPPTERQVFRDGYVAEVVTATEDWGVRNVIGGIVPQLVRDGDRRALAYQIRHGYLTRAVLSNYTGYDGVAPPATFQRQEVQDGTARCRGRWLVIDEFTRAPIDAAFGSLLTTLGGQRSPLAVPTDDGEVQVPLPRDFRIIGTLNSFDRHFLNQISEAMKRRFTFIDVLPPGLALADAERGAAATRALRSLNAQGLLDITEDTAEGRLIWEDVVTITRAEHAEGEAPSYTLDWDDADGKAALDSFWRIFGAIRVYRKLGTAQAETMCSALFSGHMIGMSWAEALDSGLADTLADQLQVIARDEQRVLLAYLDQAGNPERFVERVRQILGGLPAARQIAHLTHLQSADHHPGSDVIDDIDATKLSKDQLGRIFTLDSPLTISGRGLFAQRLRSFVGERGL
ncbi:AAA family ATPase [Oscillochloris sp. ZM17-4]|uniref:AAA family ATPase n=1 Tax=Oscillochloris sp. ZM17-4 TaxID=2866714 RepID=UPI001C72AE48|nr:AAA family ATPase [Oscillochloris sp. ZM17-4]MBX0330172.1 AAA family ATPase [Oscillochloris sp. ZM17-4]